MQTCFFAISGVLPRDEAIDKIKKAIRKTYGRRGEIVVQQNFAAVDHTLSHLYEVEYPNEVTSTIDMTPPVSGRGAGVRPGCDRADHRRQWRQPACLGLPGGRHLAHGHDPVGEAQPGAGDPGLG